MSQKPSDPSAQLLTLLRESTSFAENLLRENEQIRLSVAALEARSQAAEQERDALRDSLSPIESATAIAMQRFQALEEELNAMANLHVATWQLHSDLSVQHVVTAVLEICINFVGAFHVCLYVNNEREARLEPVAQQGHGTLLERVGPDHNALPEALADELLVAAQPLIRPNQTPVAVVPLLFGRRVLGAIVVEDLLPQKEALGDLDLRLFEILSRQAATALYGAFLAQAVGRPIEPQSVREYVKEKG